jgi:predicted protein tyrosine phosphatase
MSDEYKMNRIANASNQFQGKTKRVLCVCSAGLLRSPTTAVVLSQAPYNFNTRAAGLEKEFALIPVDDVLIAWADEIVCMTAEQGHKMAKKAHDKTILVLNIPDSFPYRDPELMKLIAENYDAAQVELAKAEKEEGDEKE